MYTIYVGEEEVKCDSEGHPLIWGEHEIYHSGGLLEYIGDKKVYRDSSGKATHLGNEKINRDSSGQISSIGSASVSGVLNLD